MRTTLLFLIWIISIFSLNAQLVISEISYNPPESGTDSLEYIELYNATDSEIDLTGYMVADNNADTLTGGTVAGGGYVVLARNPEALSTILGVNAIAIPNVALNNSGEKITLQNPSGNLIDEVTYADDGDWPSFDDGTDGQGATIELCNLEADNTNGANWRVSTNDLGVTVNDKSFLGTPGAANSASCEAAADYTVEVSSNVFTPAELTIQIGETVKWINTGGFHNVNGTQSTYPDNPESFSSGNASNDSWEYFYTFNTPGRYDYQCDPHVGFGMVGVVIVEAPQGPSLRAIGDINGVNAEGLPEFRDTIVRVQGVVHGENLNPSGYLFSIVDVDNEEGIGVFSGENLGYQYAEGDMIEVMGPVTFFNGLTQISPTSVTFVSADNDLMTPRVVSTLDESTESLLVQINGVEIVDPTQWEGDGGSFNVEFTDGIEVFMMRIDGDSQLSSEPAPEGKFNLVGMGGQFDSSSPFLEGYQLFPRSLDDFMLSSAEDYRLNANIVISPNPATYNINISTDSDIDRYEIYDMNGKVLKQGAYQETIHIDRLPRGSYLIKFSAGDRYDVKPFIKR